MDKKEGRRVPGSGMKTFKKCKSATFTLDGTCYKIGEFFFVFCLFCVLKFTPPLSKSIK